MDFNFYQQYQSLTTAELLIIVSHEGTYQAEAVEAAKSILDKRQISEEDHATVAAHFQNITDKQQQKQQKQARVRNIAEDFLEPVLKPNGEVKPQKWLNILLAVFTVQYGWGLYLTIKEAVQLLNCNGCRFDFVILIDCLSLIYVPIIFYLLYKKKRWGWILLFANNLICLLFEISNSYAFFKYQSIHHASIADFLFPILLRSAFTYFLWRQDIAAFFCISLEAKKITALVSIGLALLFIAAMMIAYS